MLRLFENRKKRYFKIKIQKTEFQIWDLEFRRHQLRGIREEMRQQRDRVKETYEVGKRRYEDEKAKGAAADGKILEQVDSLVKRCEPDLEQLAKQISDLDNEIEGTNADGQVVNPNAITQLIQGNRQLLEMIRQYVKTI